jgi:hypothetical protein
MGTGPSSDPNLTEPLACKSSLGRLQAGNNNLRKLWNGLNPAVGLGWPGAMGVPLQNIQKVEYGGKEDCSPDLNFSVVCPFGYGLT